MRKKQLSLELLTRQEMYEAVTARRNDREDPRARRRREALAEIIANELTDEQREAVMMYYYQGLNMKQIARILRINTSAVSKRLLRARVTIRKYLKYSF